MSETDMTQGTEAEVVEKQTTEEKSTPEPKYRVLLAPDNMTLGAMEEFEDIAGVSFRSQLRKIPRLDPMTGKQMKDPDPEAKGAGLFDIELSAKAMTILTYMGIRKTNPEITLDQVRSMPPTDIEYVGEDGEDVAPLDDENKSNDEQ